jgi:hypothetical protein
MGIAVTTPLRMNDSPRSRPDAGDDWLDALLRADGREHRADYVDDDGFTARVLATLPASPVALPAWRKPALAALWAVAGVGIAFALPATATDVAHEVMRAILAQPVSVAGLGAVFVALLASAWTAAALVLRTD